MVGGHRAGASSRSWHRALSVLAVAGFVLGFTLAALLLTLRSTALNANWYRNAIDDSHAYGRIYDRVLTDPAGTRETVVNGQRAIVVRARRCAAVRGRKPNFVQVDFSTLGNVPGAVDVLNGIQPAR